MGELSKRILQLVLLVGFYSAVLANSDANSEDEDDGEITISRVIRQVVFPGKNFCFIIIKNSILAFIN